MKEKSQVGGGDVPTDTESVDYVVGQVSGSLFPKDPSCSSGSLSALFKLAPASAPVMFVPAPKLEYKTTEVAEIKGATVKGPNNEKQKKALANVSAADRAIENRERALYNADEEERSRKTPKKTKRKAVDLGERLGGGLEEEEERPGKRQRTPANMAEERIKMKRTVFVGNLPVSCTKKTLEMLFRGNGAIESVRFRSVVGEDIAMSHKVAAIQRKVHPKKQNINAYIVFKEEEGAGNALARNGMEIEKDLFIRVDRVSPKQTHDHKRSIFIGNLPFDVKELPVRQHFKDCGKVEAVRLVRDKTSGMGKGFGYILFENADSVQLALKLEGSKIQGRSIRVKRSVKKAKEKKGSALNRGPKGKARTAAKKVPGKELSGTKTAGRKVGPSKGGFKEKTGQQPPKKAKKRPAKKIGDMS
ncbi:RNA-binding protein 34 [Aplochiton taeniatus]